MKSIISFLASLFMLSSFVLSVKIKNTQLFEVFQKTLNAQIPSSKNSVFVKIEKVNLIK
jgi:hypothetical protein